MGIPEGVLALLAKGVSVQTVTAAFDKLWKWGKTAQYERAKSVAMKEMLKGDGCDWAVVEAIIAESHDRKDNKAETIRLREMHRKGKPASKRKATKKKGAKKKATKKKAAKKKAV